MNNGNYAIGLWYIVFLDHYILINVQEVWGYLFYCFK